MAKLKPLTALIECLTGCGKYKRIDLNDDTDIWICKDCVGKYIAVKKVMAAKRFSRLFKVPYNVVEYPCREEKCYYGIGKMYCKNCSKIQG